MSHFDLFFAPFIQSNALTTKVLKPKVTDQDANTVDIHFSDVCPDFAMDTGTAHTT